MYNPQLETFIAAAEGWFDGVDEFALASVLDKVARITSGSSVAEIKEFADYLTIFEVYRGRKEV